MTNAMKGDYMTEGTKVIELMGTKIRLYFKGDQTEKWLPSYNFV